MRKFVLWFESLEKWKQKVLLAAVIALIPILIAMVIVTFAQLSFSVWNFLAWGAFFRATAISFWIGVFAILLVVFFSDDM